MSEVADLKDQYLEAVRMFLWYQGSPFSFHQGKASKDLADKYRRTANHLYIEYLKKKKT
jgi:hypothetical protein